MCTVKLHCNMKWSQTCGVRHLVSNSNNGGSRGKCLIVYIVWSRHQVTMSLDVTVSHLGDHKSSVQSGNELHWCSVIFTQMLCPNYNLHTICWKFIFQVSKKSLVIMSFKLNLEMNIVRIRAWGSVIFILMLCHKDMCYELTMICIMVISVIRNCM